MSTSESLSGLAAVDPERVPLPHGCEVTLRRDTSFGEHRLAMGTVGRVTGHPGPGRVQVTAPSLQLGFECRLPGSDAYFDSGGAGNLAVLRHGAESSL